MKSKKLRRPCKRCTEMFEPHSKGSRICETCKNLFKNTPKHDKFFTGENSQRLKLIHTIKNMESEGYNQLIIKDYRRQLKRIEDSINSKSRRNK